MRRAWLVCACVLAMVSLAQGQIDVSSSGGTSPVSYTTLGAAFSAINAGVHTDSISIAVTGNTTETAPAALNGSGGSSSYVSIVIEPSGGAWTITGSILGPLVDLSGADNVTIDGLNTGGNALTFENTSTAGGYGHTSGPSTIRFVNDATNNTIRNVTVNGSCGTSPVSQTGTIYFGSRTSGMPDNVTGNDDNTITNCDIGAAGSNLPVNAIWALGSTSGTTRANSGVVISDNNIHDFYYAGGASVGMYVINGNMDWTISGNSFYQTSPRTQTGGSSQFHYGIYISNYLGTGYDISGNYMGGSAPMAGGSPWSVTGARTVGFIGYYISVVDASIQDNTIANFAWSTNSDWTGMQIVRGTVGVGTVTGNTIGSSTGTGSIVFTPGLSNKTVYGIDAASSSGSVTVANNTVGGITSSGSTTSISTNIIGIRVDDGVVAVDDNLVGSETTAHSLYASNPSTSGTGQGVTGILSNCANVLSVQGNVVANLTNAYVAAGTAGYTRGIVTTSGTNTIVGNTVRDFLTSSGSSASGVNAAVLGIAQTSTGGGTQTVSQNVVHSLADTASGASPHAVGVYYSGASFGSHLVSRNIVHSLGLSTDSTTASITGIQAASGAATYRNNMVRLGIDAAGDTITAAMPVTGILKASSSDCSFHFNSVWIGGSGVGDTATNTYAFRRTATGVDDVRDNIFSNVRENDDSGGIHFAMVLNEPTTVTSDHNLYWTATGVDLWSLDGGATTLSDIRTLRFASGYGQDANSGVGEPNFAAPSGPASTVSLRLADPTPAEGAGQDIVSVTLDQEGDTRSTLTPVDIGADAGDYVMDASTDVYTPTIDYTPLTDTFLVEDRVLTAQITDVGPSGGGIPTSGPNLPRIWYRIATDPTWVESSAGTLVSGDGLDGTWEFTLHTGDLAPQIGETIEYYVVAQDQASTPNIWYRPVTADGPVHTDVSTQTVPPSAPESYEITGSLAGTYYVPNEPAGRGLQSFPTLTTSRGFFRAANLLPFSGDVTVIINGDLTDEDGSYELGEWLEEGAGDWTLTIRPDTSMTYLISGSGVASGAPLISVAGADRVSIDGRSGGSGRYLLFRNTNATASDAGPVIQFDDGSTDCVLRNTVLEGNGSSAASGTVMLGATGANESLLIAENDIRDPTAGTLGAPANALYGSSTGLANIVVSNNEIRNWSKGGVALPTAGDSIAVMDNSFYSDQASAPTTTQTAIAVGGSGAGHTVTGNWIGGSAPLCGGSAWENTASAQFTGVSLTASGTSVPAQVQGNTIANILLSGGGSAGLLGITTSSGAVRIGTTAGNTIGDATTANSIEITGAASGLIRGIVVTSTVPAEVENNLIGNISAADPGAAGTFRGFQLSPGSGGVSSVQNNTVTSILLGGTGYNSFTGIYASGSGQFDVGGTTGNTIGDPASTDNIEFNGAGGSYGIYLASYSGAQTVSNNTVANVTSGGNGSFYAIHVGVPWNGPQSTIDGNTVDRIALTNTGTSTQMRGISLVGGGSNAAYGAGDATLNNNTVGNDTEANSIVVAGGGATSGIYVYAHDTSPIEASGNIVANIAATGEGASVSLKGIYHDRGIAEWIGNSVHDLTSSSSSANESYAAALTGIYADLGYYSGVYTDNFIDQNTIYALRSTPATGAATLVSGITGGGGSTYAKGVAQRNRIYDLTNVSTSATAAIRGFNEYLGGWTVANNQIALTNDPYTNPVKIAGIYQGSGGAYYYNSVLIGGTQDSGTADSYAFVRPTNVNPTIRNNVFFNDRQNTGTAAGGHYAIANLYLSWSVWFDTSSDYNVFVAPDSSAVGRFSSTDLDFAGWQSGSGGDEHSLWETSDVVTSGSLFSDPSAGDLDILVTSGYDTPPIVSNVGTPLATQMTDFGGSDVRGDIPDIGSDEILVDRTLSAAGSLKPATENYPGHYDDVTVASGGAPTLVGPVHVFGVLTLEGENVTTDAHVLTVREDGSVSRTSGHVVGNLRKHVAAGATMAQSFEVGTGTSYAPIDLEFDVVDSAGYLVATTTAAEHPDIASTDLDTSRDVNRYWTVNNEAVEFSTYDATFTFDPADIDTLADPNNFEVRKYDAPSWTSPTVGTRTATSTEALDMATFSDFAVGEVQQPNSVPVVTDVAITGIPEIGELLTGSYTYSDVDGDPEGTSTFRWLRDGVPITDATDLTYLLAAEDESTMISFEVTPVAASGASPGLPVESDAVGPIQQPNSVPVATDVAITGSPEVGALLTGSYTYSDVDGDPEGTSTFRWLRDGAPITDATDQTYLLVTEDEGAMISFEVTPVAESGDSPGLPVESDAIGPIFPGTGVDTPVTAYELSQAHPNPFNPSTAINYALPGAGHATLRIYSLGGRLVRSLVDRQLAPGRYTAVWDGRDDSGDAVVSGVYFYRLVVRGGDDTFVETRKMTMMK